jgi:hypothetical protein
MAQHLHIVSDSTAARSLGLVAPDDPGAEAPAGSKTDDAVFWFGVALGGSFVGFLVLAFVTVATFFERVPA